jgi:uncharacterized membrane protein
MGKVIATFKDADSAEKAVDDLKRNGFEDKEISLVAKDHRAETPAGGPRHNLTTGATVGAGIGAGATALATAGALVIPGIGPILALGPLAALLTGAAIGGLTGAFVDWGIPRPESQRLQKEVEEGRAVVLVEAKNADKAKEILRRHATEVQALD